MRTFVAVVPPPEVTRTLVDVGTDLRRHLEGLRWVAGENLHFTLRFFGDLTSEEVTRAAQVVDHVAEEAVSFPVELDRLGVFPGWSRPRVLWAGCGTGAPTLEALARTLERKFEEAGLGRSDKEFRPHLTLARWRDHARLRGDALRDLCGGQGIGARFGVSEIRIQRSVLGSGGPAYSLLHAARLSAPR